MSHANILIVDNDRDFRQSLRKHVLNEPRYTIYEAEDFEAAKHILAEQLIHLAVVDVRLKNDDDPNDKLGLRLCQEMDPMIARVVLTGYTGDWQLVRSFGEPTENRSRLADGFVSKREPDSQERLVAIIEKALTDQFEILPERRFAVLTSGGDAPGMNAAIWGVVRTAMMNGIEVVGVHDGYRGLVENRMHKLRWSEVSDIMALSGTILGTARLPAFQDAMVRQKAVDNLLAKQVSGLIVIGGDGSMQGAQALARDIDGLHRHLQTVAIPGTIDNDLCGTDLSLGASTAADAMVANVRYMATTGQALHRIYVGEVMGALSGYLALRVAVATGADAVFIPETVIEVFPPTDDSDKRGWKERVSLVASEQNLLNQIRVVAEKLQRSFKAGNRSGFVVLAEGIGKLTNDQMKAKFVQDRLADLIKEWPTSYPPDVRPHDLGYPPRGAPPNSFDVWFGARLGAEAVRALLEGDSCVMVGRDAQGCIGRVAFSTVVAKSNRPPREIWKDRSLWHELLDLQQSLGCTPFERPK